MSQRPKKTTKVVTQVTKSPAPRRGRRRRRNRKVAKQTKTRVIQTHPGMAKCAQEYAKALVNPFGMINTLPCIPDVLTIPSFKYQTKARGVFSTGTLGLGYVLYNPWCMMWNNGAVGIGVDNISAPVLFTTNAFDQNNLAWVPAEGLLPTGVAYANANGPFRAEDLVFTNNTRQIRLVAAGIRISYVGSNFRNQGRVILYRNQGNLTIPSGTTPSQMLQDNYTSIVPVSRRSEYVFYSPDDQVNIGYRPASIFDPNGLESTDRKCMAIVVDGGDTENPQSWLFEAVAYFEAIGSNLVLSPSHSDTNSMGHIVSSLPVKAPTTTPQVTQQTLFARIQNTLVEQFGNVAVQAAGAFPAFAANQALRYARGPMNQMVSVSEVDEL